MRRVLPVLLALLTTLPVAQPASASCTPRLVVLSAFPGEIDKLLTNATIHDVTAAGGRRFFVGELAGNDVVLALTGIGLVNADATARLAVDTFGCESGEGISGIVFSGVAGGRTYIGDVAIPSRWTLDGETFLDADSVMVDTATAAGADVALTRDVPVGDAACAGVDPNAATSFQLDHAPEVIAGGDGKSGDPFGGRRFPCFPGGGDVFGCEPCRAPGQAAPDVGRFATGIAPFLDPSFIAGFFQSPPSAGTTFDAEDMETYAVANVAQEFDLPFIAFRAVSDGRGDPLMLPGFPFQFFYYRQLAAENAARVTLAFLHAWAA